MGRLRLVAAVVALSAIIASPFVYANGLWFGLPIVGNAGYCSTNVAGVPGTAGTCTVSVPAGTTVYPDLTGSEMIPADTGVITGGPNSSFTSSVSGTPQTVYIPMVSVASGSYLLTGPVGTVTASVSTPQGITNLIIQATGTITTLNVAPPPSPYDGQLWRVNSDQTATTFTLQTPSSGQNFDTPTKPTTLVLSTGSGNAMGFSFVFNAASNKWYRMQ